MTNQARRKMTTGGIVPCRSCFSLLWFFNRQWWNPWLFLKFLWNPYFLGYICFDVTGSLLWFWSLIYIFIWPLSMKLGYFQGESVGGWLDAWIVTSWPNPRNQMATSKIFHLKWTVTDCEEDYRPLCCAFRSKWSAAKILSFSLMEGILKHTWCMNVWKSHFVLWQPCHVGEALAQKWEAKESIAWRMP